VIDEQLEFQIAQYADGTLPPAERAALEQTLANDAGARALLDEYRRLDASLKRELPVPAMNWDRLAAHLSDVVAEEDRATTTVTIGWSIRSWGKVAAAAAILLLIGTISILALRPAAPITNVTVNNTTQPAVNGGNTNVTVVVVVTGPAAQAATADPVVEINVGPSQWAKDTNYGVTDQVVYREPRVMIASGRVDRQDSGRQLPF
jgi:anti-sigma factor RsiW